MRSLRAASGRTTQLWAISCRRSWPSIPAAAKASRIAATWSSRIKGSAGPALSAGGSLGSKLKRASCTVEAYRPGIFQFARPDRQGSKFQLVAAHRPPPRLGVCTHAAALPQIVLAKAKDDAAKAAAETKKQSSKESTGTNAKSTRLGALSLVYWPNCFTTPVLDPKGKPSSRFATFMSSAAAFDALSRVSSNSALESSGW
ncbi:hypothetical protein QF038_003061 [Pseudarthrobacter sp. W1I19]|nr:hypothetical protein [Pseudarthrobacter sp. W1I19]